jgi:universal stress protein A
VRQRACHTSRGEPSCGLPLPHRNALVSPRMSSGAQTGQTVWSGTLFASQTAKSYSGSYPSTPHGKAIAMETHTILVPTDFSTYAEHAWQEALAIATRDKAQVLLLHVLPPLPIPWADEWSLPRPQFEDQIQRDAEQQLQTIAAQHPVPIETLVVWGSPAAVICDVAKARQCDLIVMSTHGRTGLAHVFIGSVAERVVRYAPCAVLIVRAFRVE